MSGYIGTQPVPQGTQTRQTFVATAAQTSFATGGYQAGYLDVFLNGVKLQDGVDYTATNGSDIVLTVGAALDDTLEVVAYTAFEVLDQTFTGTTTVDVLDVTGALDVARSGSHEVVFRTTSTGDPTLNLQADGQNNGKISYVRATEGLTFSNSGSERMRITSSGSVGIGTSSPSSNAKLDVAGPSFASSAYSTYTTDGLFNSKARPSKIRTPGDGAELLFGYQDDSEGQYNPRIGFKNGTAVLATDASNSIGNVSDGSLTFNTSASNIERMRIDSAGRVTMPYQPAFLAISTAASNTGGSGFQIFGNVQTNIGGHFSAATGRFTAPVSGMYHFSATVLSRQSAYIRLDFAKNSVLQTYTESTQAQVNYTFATQTLSIYLSAGDYASVTSGSNSTYGGVYNYFSGYLIG